MNPFNPTDQELTVTEVDRNLLPGALYEHAIHRGDSELMRKFLSLLFVLLAFMVSVSDFGPERLGLAQGNLRSR